MKYKEVRNQQRKSCANKLKDNLDQEKNKFAWTINYTHPEPLQWPSTNLKGKQFHISGFNMSNIQLAIEHKYKYWHQLTLIQSTLRNKSKINGAKIIIENLKNNTLKYQKSACGINFWIIILAFGNFTTITEKWWKDDYNFKRLV